MNVSSQHKTTVANMLCTVKRAVKKHRAQKKDSAINSASFNPIYTTMQIMCKPEHLKSKLVKNTPDL